MPVPGSAAAPGAAERARLAAQGKAMPAGRYPIRNRGDLAKAIRAVGRGNGSHPAIRQHIIKRAKHMGATGMLPAHWKPDGTVNLSSTLTVDFAFNPSEPRDEHGNWIKVGDRVHVAHGSTLKGDQYGHGVSDVKGTVARKGKDNRVLVNTGTKQKPAYVVAAGKDVAPAKRQAAQRIADRAGWATSLTPQQRKAVESYKGTGYRHINGTLRHGKEPSAATRERISALDAAVGRGKVERNITAYRTFDARALPGPPTSLIGKTFTDHGFVSTSESGREPFAIAAKRVPKGRNPVLARIKIPAGTHAGFPDRVLGIQGASGYQELELLLPRDSSFRITGVKRAANGIYEMELELIA